MLHAALLAVAAVIPEYEVAWKENRWEAANSVQGFHVSFTGDGMAVSPREGSETSWDWGLTLLRYGRPGSLQSVTMGTFTPQGRRVERARPGIVEWYVNSEDGLEHGFTIAAPPRPSREISDVFVEMTFSGSMSPTFSTDGQAIDFRGADGAYLRYGKLEVVDASGRKLASRMEGFAEPGVRGIRIRFDDEGARYPVTVDPMVTTAAWTVEANQDNAQLGSGLSSAGDVNGDGYSDVIVSATAYSEGQSFEGKVWVYHGSASGPQAPAAWSIQGDQSSAQLGRVVELAGDVNGDGFGDVLVGSPNFDVSGLTDNGKIELYLGSSTGLAATPVWTLAGTASFQGLSTAASAGDVNADGFDDVLVGDGGYTNGQASEGRALLYLGSAAGLATSASWSIEGNKVDALLGSAVASAGDVDGDGYGDVIVGAPFWNNGGEQEGRAEVYLGSASGLSPTPVWTKESDQAFAWFGVSVGTVGDVNGDGYADIIVGAPRYTNGQSGEGAAFVYLGAPGGPATTHAWMVESNQAPTPGSSTPTEYGGSVSTAGDVNGDGYADVIVGAVAYDDPVQEEGAMFLYLGSATGLSTTHDLRFRSGQLNAQLGRTVRGAGDVNGDGYTDLLASSTGYDNGHSNEGRAWLYLGAGGTFRASADWVGEGGQDLAAYGAGVASAGDVNGDGYSDILVGAPSAAGPVEFTGKVYLYLGSPTGPALAPASTIVGTHASESIGNWIASAGDVNGDGYSDVIVGSDRYNVPAVRAGRAFVHLGSAAGLGASPAWSVNGSAANEMVGRQVASAGDVNGDGYADVLVLSLNQLALYLGSSTGPSALPAWLAPAPATSGTHATSIASAGDVNGDGRSDVIVGAPGYSNVQLQEGRAAVYLGTPSGLTPSPAWTFESDQALTRLGASSDSAGDVNGDGYADVVVGQPMFTNPSTNEGRLLVFLGSSTGLQASPAFTIEGNQVDAQLGGMQAGVADVNLDGFGDVVAGLPNQGTARLYLGSPAGLATDPAATVSGDPGSAFAYALADAGDVNGDAFPDLIVGAFAYANGQPNEGAAFVFFGNQSDGFDRLPRQQRIDGSAPIHFLGKSTSETEFRLAERGISPAGRSKIRLQWEVKPLGTPFDGTGIGSTPLSDTGPPTASGSIASLAQPITGLEEGTPYHWRTRIVGSSPYFPASPWKSIANNVVTESKLRTGGCVDVDGDGFGALADPSCGLSAQDCLDADATVWALPGETSNLVFTTKSSFGWSPPGSTGTSVAVTYAVVRLDAGAGFTGPVCLSDPNNLDTTITLSSDPAPGSGHYFLSQARNACGPGTFGVNSFDAERVFPLLCP